MLIQKLDAYFHYFFLAGNSLEIRLKFGLICINMKIMSGDIFFKRLDLILSIPRALLFFKQLIQLRIYDSEVDKNFTSILYGFVQLKSAV